MDTTCVAADTVLYSQPDPSLKKANATSAPLHINVFVTKCKKNLKAIDESQTVAKRSPAADKDVITRESTSSQIDVIKKDVQNVQLLGQKPPVITIYTSNTPPKETQHTQTQSLDGPVIIVEHISKINSDADHQNSTNSSAAAQKYEDASHKCEFEECEYSSHNKHYLKQHIDIVHNTDRPFKCPFCDYAGKRSHSLREHLVVHSNERPYECSHCNATFRKKGHLTNHIKMHTSQKISKCSLCDETMTENVDYYVHLRTVHNMEAIYTCDSCEYASTKWNNLTLHMQVHSKTKQNSSQAMAKCSLCIAILKDNNDMYSHLRSVHGNDVLLFSCQLCNYATTQKGILALHMKVHKDPMYKCKKCGITMFNFDSLAGHSEEICNRMCSELKSSETKLNTSQDTAGVMLMKCTSQDTAGVMLMKCTECGFTANDKEAMKDHMWSHIDRNIFSPLADTTTNKGRLASNKSDLVASDLPTSKQSSYQCSECQYSCREAFTFKAHMQSHKLKLPEVAMVTERPHSGDGMPFTHDSRLDRFSCTICGYTCDYQRTIKAHIWKHSGHQDVDYPMFQNGPLSIYDESPIVKEEAALEKTVVSVGLVKTVCTPAKSSENMSQVSSSRDGTSLSPVLVHLLSSKPGSVVRDMAALEKHNEEMDSIKKIANTTQNADVNFSANVSTSITSARHDVERPKSLSICSYSSSGDLKRKHGFVPRLIDTISNLSKKLCAEGIHGCRNVIVESIRSTPSNSDLTGLKSQQGSPRVPDVGASCEVECIVDSLEDKEHVMSTRNLLNNIESRHAIMSEIKQSNTMHSGLMVEVGDAFIPPYSNVNVGAETVVSDAAIGSPSEDDQCGNIPLPVIELLSEETEPGANEGNDSALTLLSLLKKTQKPLQTDSITNTAKVTPDDGPNEEDTGTTEDLTEDGNEDQTKPKSGICSSLLAVIEQLRDRSKSESESEVNGTEEPGKKTRKRGKKLSPNVSNNIEDLVNIEKMESCDIKYRCRLCHYSNNSALQMRQHMRLHKTKKPFECSLCEFVASSSWSLQDHMIQHCKVRLYQCKQCDVAFNYKSQLRAHMRSHNDNDLREPYLCESCDFETLDYYSFRDHVKTHKGNMLCDGFSYADLQIDSEENLKAYNCENCEFITNDRDDFIHHDKICKREVHCPYCSFSCSNMTSYRHHSKLHEEEMTLKCDMCDFSAVSSRSLKSHMKRHINDQRYVQQPLEQYKCNICGYVCHHLPSLKSHLWRHASDKNYSYEFTNEIINAAIDYDARSDGTESEKLEGLIVLDALMKKAIEVDRELADQNVDAVTSACFVTFRCCQCGFETINKADLNVHMRSHKDIIQRTLEVMNAGVREKR